MFLIGETNLVDKNLVETNSLLRRGNEKKSWGNFKFWGENLNFLYFGAVVRGCRRLQPSKHGGFVSLMVADSCKLRMQEGGGGESCYGNSRENRFSVRRWRSLRRLRTLKTPDVSSIFGHCTCHYVLLLQHIYFLFVRAFNLTNTGWRWAYASSAFDLGAADCLVDDVP